MTTSGSLGCLKLLDVLEAKVWATPVCAEYNPNLYTLEPVPRVELSFPSLFLSGLEVRVYCVEP